MNILLLLQSDIERNSMDFIASLKHPHLPFLFVSVITK